MGSIREVNGLGLIIENGGLILFFKILIFGRFFKIILQNIQQLGVTNKVQNVLGTAPEFERVRSMTITTTTIDPSLSLSPHSDSIIDKFCKSNPRILEVKISFYSVRVKYSSIPLIFGVVHKGYSGRVWKSSPVLSLIGEKRGEISIFVI